MDEAATARPSRIDSLILAGHRRGAELGALLGRPRVFAAVAVAGLAVGLLLIATLLRAQWFVLDEFDYLQPPSGQGYVGWLIQPHNEHTIFFTKLWFSSLYSVIGLNAYPVYAIPLLAAHAVVVVAVFLLLRTAGLPRLLAALAAAAVLLMGAAAGTLTWAGQMQYTGSVAAGLVVALIAVRTPTRWTWALALGVSLFGTFNGSAYLSYAIAVGLILLLRRRWLLAAIVALPAALWFVASRLLFDIPSDYAAHSAGQVLRDGATLAAAVLDRALLDTLKVPGITGAVLVVLALGVLAFLNRPTAPSASRMVLATFLAIVLMSLAIIVIGRLSRPVVESSNGGYSYLLLVSVIPIVALLVHAFAWRTIAARLVVVLAFAIAISVGFATMQHAAVSLAAWKQNSRSLIQGAAYLADTDFDAVDSATAAPDSAPTYTWLDISDAVDDGALSATPPSDFAAEMLSLNLQVGVKKDSSIPASACSPVAAGTTVTLPAGGTLVLVGDEVRGSTVTLTGADQGATRSFSVKSAGVALTSVASDPIAVTVDAAFGPCLTR